MLKNGDCKNNPETDTYKVNETGKNITADESSVITFGVEAIFIGR